jgi:phospholipid-binding lipoprotein MlaA
VPSLTSCIPPRWRALLLPAALLLLLLGGCASTGNPRDPFEPVNRGIYKFNDHADNLLIKPAAELYRGRLIPEFVRTGVSNFFSNINDVIVALNNLLQGKLRQAASDVGRIAVNTTVGILGVLDVATDMGLEKHNEDFGQTLGYWGLGSGPYLVLPFLGPSSVRDGIGLIGDIYSDPRTYVDPVRTRNQIFALGFISRRSELLEAGRLLEAAALDPYDFLRDAYLQRRRNLVYDGNPPDEEEIEAAPKSGQRPGNDMPSAASGTGSGIVASSGPAPVAEDTVEVRMIVPAATPPLRAESTSQQPTAPAKTSRVVRVWLPANRN